ncbi:MAG: Calx-beta domain-containing protein [Chthoniobacterales bacterium]
MQKTIFRFLFLAASLQLATAYGSTLSFSPTQYTVNEGRGSIVLTVTLDRSADPDPGDTVTVDYKTLSGTATGSRDATASNPADYFDQDSTDNAARLSFAPGELSKTITIAIIDDTLVENSENFSAIIFNPLSGNKPRYGVPLVTNATATITIIDNDVGSTVRFNPTSYAVAEQAGDSSVTLTITAARLGDPNTPITVAYGTSDGSAKAGADYFATDGVVNFGPGETEKTITVTVRDDNLIENAEDFFVSLSSPSGATLDPAGGSVATVTISDNDAGTSTIQFDASSYTVSENDGVASLTVVRSGGLGFAVSAHYFTTDGSARASSDYTATSSTVVFAPGELSKTITVPILNDSTPEGTETFSVTLAGVSDNAVLGTPIVATVAIIDDDPPPPPDNSTKVLNVSTRGPVQAGDNVMIAGFIIRGEAPKPVILRGIGPSLASLGVVDAISDPNLTLFDENGTQLAFNDDYGTNSPADRTFLQANGLTPQDSREAALVTSLAPANYTLILRGSTNGIGLVEVYDISRTTASRFANIATRGKVEQGDNGAMIAGFIIGMPPGQTGVTRRLVIRANGPSLTSAGVSGALVDPTLDLYRGSQLILSNDNWKTNSTADRNELTGFGLAPNNDKEAAIVTSLDPGSYSAVVRGKNNTTGVALVEVFQVDQ